uniref:Uncharacterized protein n=1 Tax=Bionectria ochroleuca TaxID=29856 RepID=A0A8H7N7N8_BIOOC
MSKLQRCIRTHQPMQLLGSGQCSFVIHHMWWLAYAGSVQLSRPQSTVAQPQPTDSEAQCVKHAGTIAVVGKHCHLAVVPLGSAAAAAAQQMKHGIRLVSRSERRRTRVLLEQFFFLFTVFFQGPCKGAGPLWVFPSP